MPRVVPIQIDEKWPSLTGIRSWVMFFLTWSIDIALAKLGRASANQPYPYPYPSYNYVKATRSGSS